MMFTIKLSKENESDDQNNEMNETFQVLIGEMTG